MEVLAGPAAVAAATAMERVAIRGAAVVMPILAILARCRRRHRLASGDE